MAIGSGQFRHPFVQHFLRLHERPRSGLRVLAQCFLLGESARALELEILPHRDVIENNTDVPQFRRPDAERANLVIAMQSSCRVLEAKSLPGKRNAAIDVEPVLLMLGGNLAHEPAAGVFDPRLPLKYWIDFQEAIV